MKVELQVFARAPLSGHVKTRLIPVLGAEGAARLQQRMTQNMVEEAVASAIGNVVLCCTPDGDHNSFRLLKQQFGVELEIQQGRDVGERMAAAIGLGLQRSDAVILAGSDCPQLDQDVLLQVENALEEHDVVMVPAEDGGYVLVAMREPLPDLFSAIEWGSSRVVLQSEQVLRSSGIQWCALEPLNDIDRPEDLKWVPEQWLSREWLSE